MSLTEMSVDDNTQKFKFRAFGRIGVPLILGAIFFPYWMSVALREESVFALALVVLGSAMWVTMSVTYLRDRFRPRWIVVDETGIEVPGHVWGRCRFEFVNCGATRMGFWGRSIELRDGKNEVAVNVDSIEPRARFVELCDLVADRVEIATGRRPE